MQVLELETEPSNQDTQRPQSSSHQPLRAGAKRKLSSREGDSSLEAGNIISKIASEKQASLMQKSKGSAAAKPRAELLKSSRFKNSAPGASGASNRKVLGESKLGGPSFHSSYTHVGQNA